MVDTSLIPGGYGIYRLPYDREKEIFLSEKLEMVYALDPEKQYTDIYASPDGAKLFLVSQAARLTGSRCQGGAGDGRDHRCPDDAM